MLVVADGSQCHVMRARAADSLAGLRLFFFSLGLLPESCEAMESVCPTLGESAMALWCRRQASGVGRDRGGGTRLR